MPGPQTKIILGIETSCDETAVALILHQPATANTPQTITVLGSLISSQIDIHAPYGGVFPQLAKRAHSERIIPLIEELFTQTAKKYPPFTTTKIEEKNIDALATDHKINNTTLIKALKKSSLATQLPVINAIAITEGPGLEPALWVGINTAQLLGALWNIPVYPIHHMEGHAVSPFINETATDTQTISTPSWPFLALLISGGHTELVRINEFGSYTTLGRTKDDAAGEAFDKIARMLGLAYPGGPKVSQQAALARREQPQTPAPFALPRPMLNQGLDFSFSGLKTAVLYGIKKILPEGETEGKTLDPSTLALICREAEDAITDVLVHKTGTALTQAEQKSAPYKGLIVAGGVSANTHIRQALTAVATEHNLPIYFPTTHTAGDNALMIATALALRPANHQPLIPPTLTAYSDRPLEQA